MYYSNQGLVFSLIHTKLKWSKNEWRSSDNLVKRIFCVSVEALLIYAVSEQRIEEVDASGASEFFSRFIASVE